MRQRIAAFQFLYIGLAVFAAGEAALRGLDGALAFERPVNYGTLYMDVCRDTFRNHFLPQATFPGLLVAGSSNSDTNVDAVQLESAYANVLGERVSAYNGSMYGARVDDVRFLLDWYWKQWKFKRLVINVEPGVLRPGRVTGMQEGLSRPAIEQWMVDNLRIFRHRARLHWIDPDDEDTPARLRADNLTAFDAEATMRGWERTLVMPRTMRDFEDLTDSLVTPMLEWTPDFPKVEEMARWAKERSLETTFIVPPMHPLFVGALPREWSMDTVAARTRAIAEQYGHRFLDLRALEFPNEDFSDPTHLNSRGAIKFSRVLSWRLAEMEKSGTRTLVEPATFLDDTHFPAEIAGRKFSEAARTPLPGQKPAELLRTPRE
jgi:hypothetical protein